MPEFGPRVPVGVPRKRAVKAHRSASGGRPEGTLVAHLTEHTAAITSLAVSPDSVFFATGSDDGSVRIWDAMRLEKSVTSRPRQVLRHSARVTTLCMLEKSHCVASASADGTLCVHRVDVDLSGSLPKYGKAQSIRQMSVEPAGDHITVMAHAMSGALLLPLARIETEPCHTQTPRRA
jgi:phosphoinositide-3-kinase regulatory subunit 4